MALFIKSQTHTSSWESFAYETGDFVESNRRYRFALATFTDLGDQAGIARCYFEVGLVECALGNYAGAEAALAGAIDRYQQLSDQEGVARSLVKLGKVYLERGFDHQGILTTLNGVSLGSEVERSSAVPIGLRQLAEYRNKVGYDSILTLLEEFLDDESLLLILQMLSEL